MVDDERAYLTRNAMELGRLRALGSRLLSGDLVPQLAGGWTPSAVFAHLAFWDRLVLARWELYDRDGVIETLPDTHTDLVNAAGMRLWLDLPREAAVAEAIEAAHQVVERIAALSPEAVDVALATGRRAMLDRTFHWTSHLDGLAGVLPPV
ncbi:MAG: hypothetical protein ABR950_00960 [Candidatus Dormibacteria bacterium]|jgi:hypothetical protein